MKDYKSSLFLLENQKTVEKLNDYLRKTLGKLAIVGAVAFGSAVRGNAAGGISDVDIVAYSSYFERETAGACIEIIAGEGGNFSDKAPIFLEDFISPRIEYFYILNGIAFDINIFPITFYSYERNLKDAVHNTLEVQVGAMYENAVLLFGYHPYEQIIQGELLPFYGDEIRKDRMKSLESRITSMMKKIELQIGNGADDLLFLLYKTRNYFIKYLFVRQRKYPVDLERYLREQLDALNVLNDEEINGLLLMGTSRENIYDNFKKVIEKFLNLAASE